MFTMVLRGQKNADPLKIADQNHQTRVVIGETHFPDPLSAFISLVSNGKAECSPGPLMPSSVAPGRRPGGRAPAAKFRNNRACQTGHFL
jgi:hypothetical protein